MGSGFLSGCGYCYSLRRGASQSLHRGNRCRAAIRANKPVTASGPSPKTLRDLRVAQYARVSVGSFLHHATLVSFHPASGSEHVVWNDPTWPGFYRSCRRKSTSLPWGSNVKIRISSIGGANRPCTKASGPVPGTVVNPAGYPRLLMIH